MEKIKTFKTKSFDVCRFIGHLLNGPHAEGYHSDHPLDRPVEPVTDWTDSGEPTIQFNPGELFHLLNDDDIIQAYLESKKV